MLKPDPYIHFRDVHIAQSGTEAIRLSLNALVAPKKGACPAGGLVGGPRRAPPCTALGLCLFDELDGVADRQDRIRCIIGNFDAELFFECHDQFDGVERVRAQIVDEACAFRNLFGIDAKMINNNFLYAFCYVAHVGFLDLCFFSTMPC